jgi:hypothetical protein
MRAPPDLDLNKPFTHRRYPGVTKELRTPNVKIFVIHTTLTLTKVIRSP